MATTMKEFLQEAVFGMTQQNTQQQQNTNNPNQAVQDAKQVNNNPTSDDRNNARIMIQRLRGVPVGRQVNLTSQQPMNTQGADKNSLATIIKNDNDELVFCYEVDGVVTIASISKSRNTIHETVLLQRNVQFLKRFMMQA